MRKRHVILGLLLPFLLFSCKAKKEEGNEPVFDSAFHESYVVVVSLDGFRWDYGDIYEAPVLSEIEAEGLKAEYLLPSFPTKTFPNHYALATGLYPDHNGIINNSFYAPDMDKLYRIGDRSMVENPDSYFGEPIWVTAEKQGQKAACYFWVGSEAPIKGISPSYWYPYDGSVPYGERISQAFKWLSLPLAERPRLVMLYFDEPDGVGHDHGPEHDQTGDMITYLDGMLGQLREQIDRLPYADRVNLIVLSDHGMGPISPERYVNLREHIPESWSEQIIGGNPVYLITPLEGFADSITMALEAVEGVSAWQRDEIPPRLHYGESKRFPGVVAVADSLWSLGTRESSSGYSGGTHGYDNAFSDMHTIFYAEGPAFKEAYSSPPFANVEVYGIIAHILGLEPVETDGDLENVRHLFR